MAKIVEKVCFFFKIQHALKIMAHILKINDTQIKVLIMFKMNADKIRLTDIFKAY